MKKRNRYNRNAFQFHKYAVSRKSNGSKEIVQKIACRIRKKFGEYKRLMEQDRLEDLVPLYVNDERKNALQDIYSYNSRAFRELKVILTTDENGRLSNKCPYCQLDIAGTLDHIIPQTPFPEYSSNPYNLIPCCSTCNGKKNAIWKINGTRSIINFYIDDIPDIQYLYARPRIQEHHLYIDFELNFPEDYDRILKSRLRSHYERLDLLNRYKANCDDVIEDLRLNIQSAVADGVSNEVIKRTIKRHVENSQVRYGINYWEAILIQSCIDSDEAYQFLKET